MEKEFRYNDFSFLFKIDLNYIVERCIDGHREHRLIVTNMYGREYSRTYWLDSTKSLSLQIIDAETKTMEWVDNNFSPLISHAEQELLDLGFIKS